MFLRLLNDDQKRALLVLGYHLVVSDHSVSEKEGALLDEVINGLRTEIQVTPQQLHERPSMKVFDSRAVRFAVMLEILTIAYGDNLFPEAESKMIANLGMELGFQGAELDRMREWAQRSAVLLEEAQNMMSEA